MYNDCINSVYKFEEALANLKDTLLKKIFFKYENFHFLTFSGMLKDKHPDQRGDPILLEGYCTAKWREESKEKVHMGRLSQYMRDDRTFDGVT